MAESSAHTVVSKLLRIITSPAFASAYEKEVSIWEGKDELLKLQQTIETIQAVLPDAERKQQLSGSVMNWIKRFKRLLYDAEDLFDEITTRNLIRQRTQKQNHSPIKKVLVSTSKLNPIISKHSIAAEIKAIRKSLLEISTDMAQFEFVRCEYEEQSPAMKTGQDLGSSVGAEVIIGREEDKQAVLEMLLNESNEVVPIPLVIAIVGTGGMGKTALAQLICRDDEVTRKIDQRWIACISDTFGEREVLEKIFQSINEGDRTSLSVSQLHTRIGNLVRGRKFLLVLDDVWEDNPATWKDLMSLLTSSAKGSKVIVTTRLQSVVNVVNALRVHYLKGLSEENAWCLFKRSAFAPGYENDTERIHLGREILKKCSGIPLAIRTMSRLLAEKNTIPEWQEIEREVVQEMKTSDVRNVIKLSYNHLPANLKYCFAYCSLFPRNYKFRKHELVYQWMAEGFIESDDEENGFLYLLRVGFFQEVETSELGEFKSCKMHDIVHDLAKYVAREKGSSMLEYD